MGMAFLYVGWMIDGDGFFIWVGLLMGMVFYYGLDGNGVFDWIDGDGFFDWVTYG